MSSGAFETQSADVLHHRFTHHATENPVEVKRREVRDACEIIDRQILVQVRLDMDEHPQDPLPIHVARACLHRIHVGSVPRVSDAPLDRQCENATTPGGMTASPACLNTRRLTQSVRLPIDDPTQRRPATTIDT